MCFQGSDSERRFVDKVPASTHRVVLRRRCDVVRERGLLRVTSQIESGSPHGESGKPRNFAPIAILLAAILLSSTSLNGQSTSLGIGEVTAQPGDPVSIPVLADWSGQIAGFSFSLEFAGPTPLPLSAMTIDVEGTLAGAIEAEYVQAQINLSTNTIICGVLFDALPPFNGQTLPSLGYPQEVAFIHGTILPTAAESIVQFTPQDGFGSPPINNMLVFGTTSVSVDSLYPGSLLIELPPVPQLFIRGDVNMDSVVDLADVIFHLDYTFLSGPLPSCMDAGDANDDGVSDVSDAIFLLYWFFLDGPGPWVPFPNPGEDFTNDNLDCAQGL